MSSLRWINAVLAGIWLAALCSACHAQDAPAAEDAPVAAENEGDDLMAIRAAVERYVAAFNAADAAAVAACWGKEGVYRTPDGIRLTGEQAIAEYFTDFFADNPGLSLTVTVDSLRLLSDDVALEEGTAHVEQDGEPSDDSSYVAVHRKSDGQWQLDTVRETVVSDTSEPDHPLDGLDWLVGEWSDTSQEGVEVQSSFRWSRDGHFLIQTFQVVVSDQIDLEGTQIIVWDPSRQTVRSWMFDSDGGFAEGVWTPGETTDDWTVESQPTLPDGREASSLNRYHRVDDDLMTWSSTEREVDGESLPDVEPIAVRRVDAGE